MSETPQKEWIVVHCVDAYRDAAGNPGQHKVPVPGLDTPMSRDEALQALRRIEAERPGHDFSIRRIATVVSLRKS